MSETVLIVEDSRSFSMVLSKALEKVFKIKPVVARTMAEAQAILEGATQVLWCNS